MKLVEQTVVLFVLGSPVLGTRLGERNNGGVWKDEGLPENSHRRLHDVDYFLVSQVSESQDWCIVAPELHSPYEPSYEEGTLSFGHCEPYFDGYPQEGSLQLFKLDQSGKMHSGAYDNLCMIVNNGVNIGGGLMRLDDCNINSDLNRFTYDPGAKNIRLVPPNEGYCVTNEGTTANEGDTIHAKPCGDGGRYEFEFQEAYFYYQILADQCHSQGPACMMSKNGDVPTSGDKVYIDHCGSPQDAWRFEVVSSTGAVLFHSKLDDTMCMQSGHVGEPEDGTKLRFYPCDGNDDLQRFIREFSSNGYVYKITPETQSDLCVVNHGGTCEIRDEVILKDCNNAATDVEGWYDDEAG